MSKRPIVKDGKPLKLTSEQASLLEYPGLKISLTYKDGKRKKIKKGILKFVNPGCECCGGWYEFWRRGCARPEPVGFPE